MHCLWWIYDRPSSYNHCNVHCDDQTKYNCPGSEYWCHHQGTQYNHDYNNCCQKHNQFLYHSCVDHSRNIPIVRFLLHWDRRW